MILTKLSLRAIALFTSLPLVAAAPAPAEEVAATKVPDYAILDVVPVGDHNITFYGIPDEKPSAGAALPLNKRCGSNALHCDDQFRHPALDARCVDLINSLKDPRFANNPLPAGLRSSCIGNPRQGNCCLAFTQSITGTNARWSDLVGSAYDVYSRCPRYGGQWLSGWTSDTLLGGQCGNQCLSAASFC